MSFPSTGRHPVPPCLLAFCVTAIGFSLASAQADDPRATVFEPVTPASLVQKVDFEQRLDQQIPLTLTFRDEAGRNVRLADYFGSRPVILFLGYYRCPLICGQGLNGLARSLKPLPLKFAQDFEVVTVSIDPKEQPGLAKDKKTAILRRYDKAGAEAGWHFLTGDEDQIRPLAEAVGFRYTHNPVNEQYVHPAGIVVLTPEGKISRYFYGIDFPSKDLQFAMIDASAGKVGSPVHKLLLFCYDYDPTTGRYTLAVTYLIRVVGSATALALGAYILVMLLRERRHPVTTTPTRQPVS
jgi:protein SCO1/2